ncbi:MAG: peptide deformylase [bacterium]
MIIFNSKKLKILQMTHPSLRNVSDDIKEYDKTLNDLAKSLTKLMKDPFNDGVETVGISAAQVGINVKLCICKVPGSGKNIAMVNPVVLDLSDDINKELEGCVSVGIGPNQLFAYVPRPRTVKIKYFDLKGQEAFLEAKDLMSHIVQHEIDHMYGKLFIDYIDDPNEIMTLAELNERSSMEKKSLI